MVNLDSNQLERLKAIGAYLYEVRQEQARTLEEIAAKTYIPLRILKALEAGQEKILPEPVFVQGFIRRYADVLGLDGVGISQEFPIQSTANPETSTNGSLEEAVLPPPVQVDVLPLSEGFSLRRSSSSSVIPYLVAGAVAIVALGGLLYGLSQRDSSTQPQTAAEQPQSPEAATEPDTSSIAASPSPNPPPPTPAASPTAPVTVAISLTDASWLEVSVDGEIEFEGTLNRGEQRSWTAQQSITIYSGNPGAVMVTHNQQQAAAMGQPGIPEERTYTASTTPSPASP